MQNVSVIIPIYNVEKYLAKCLDSVINQTYKNLEIICVNDCSPDNSIEIIQEYAKKDNRIKIVNREKNGGLSAARNSGLDIATGDYIYFLDSDDWLDIDYIEKMVEKIKEKDVPMILNTNITEETEKDSKPYIWGRYQKKLQEGEFLDKSNAINNSQCMIWCHLYKTSFLKENKLYFPEGYIHEDEYFQHISKTNIDKLFAFYGPSYHYLMRKDSIMKKRRSNVLNYLKILKLIYNFYKQNNLFDTNNNIKIFRLEFIMDIQTEEEFDGVKDYINLISEDFKKYRPASFDIEKFMFNTIIACKSFSDYKNKIGKNIFLSYITRYKMNRLKNIKISVIIPVYNVENYLEKCLESVCNQTFEDIEIICINDNSPDNSLDILKRYARNDNRIKIIDFKENKGVAIARNTALEQAKGEYIAFVDSDDYLDMDFYEKLYNKLKNTNSDLVIGNHNRIINGKKIPNKDFIEKIKQNKIYFNELFYLGLYKNELLKKYNIKFDENLSYGEDRLLPILAAYYANNIEIETSTFYNYLMRETSASSMYFTNAKKLNDFQKSSELIINKFNQLNYDEKDYTLFFNQYLEYIVNTLAASPKNLKPIVENIYFYYYNNVKYKYIYQQEDNSKIFNLIKNQNYTELIKFIRQQQCKQLMQKIRTTKR